MKYLFFAIPLLIISRIPDLIETTQKNYDKKINRIIYRLWDSKNPVKKEIFIPFGIYDKFSSKNFDISLLKLKHNDSLKGYLVLSNATGCRNGGCKAPEEANHNLKNTNNFLMFDNFKFAVFFDLNYTIINITVLEYESEYGYEICSKNWLKQFVKIKNEKYNYGKNIQAISGATISAQSLTDAITEIKNMMVKLKEGNYL